MLDSHVVRVTFLLLLAAGCTAAPPVRVEDAALDVLQEVRAAIGADALFQARAGVTLSGVRTSAAGASRPLSISKRPSGTFVESLGGGATSARGFDGRDAWVLRPDGVVRHLSLGSREHMLADGWLRTHLWLVPGAERFDVTVDEPSSSATRLVLQLTRDEGRLRATVELDRLTMLPAAYELARFGRTRRVTFADWASGDLIAGARFARRVEERVDGEVAQIDRFDSVEVDAARTFVAPLSSAAGVRFDPTAASEVVTRIDEEGRYLVRVSVDGASIGWMLLDSGFGAHALRRDVAESLGLTASGDANLAGVGGSGASAWCRAGALSVGPITADGPRFALLDEGLGDEVVGVLGVPLFERAIVTFDDRSGAVTLHDPARFRGEELEWWPLARDGSSACVRGRVLRGREWTDPLWLRLDTGSDDTLTVARWAVGRYALVPDRTHLRPAGLVGLFGRVEGWRAPIDGLEYGGALLARTEVSLLREDTPGPLSDPWIAGNLGVGALRGRRVVLDLTRDRVSISAAD
ncbi:MAG: retropepsin-like aspartic protease [Planctomycetota bacterium]|nr:retropepsin-like aspartic protease [Planctomycetota bacterium]